MRMNRLYKMLTLMLIVMIFAGFTTIPAAMAKPVSNPLPFDDITNSYAQKEIIRLAKLNIINGKAERTFEPQQPVTRAEFITMIARLLRLEPVDNDIAPFTDVRKGDWYVGWVQAGFNLGIVDGTRLGRFEPQKSISRQEVATIIARAIKLKSAENQSYPTFSDAGDIAKWAIPYVTMIQKNTLMIGQDNKFRPNDNMTRQETAVVLDRVLSSSFGVKVMGGLQDTTIQMGWQYDSTTAEFIDQINDSNINTLTPRWFFLTDNGLVSDKTDSQLITYAKQHDKKIWAMFGNRSDAELTHAILSDSTKRRSVIQQLTTYVKKYALDGINVDFENVKPVDRGYLTSFIVELTHELHRTGAVLSIDVSPDLGSDWTEAFDYAKLGAAADYVVLMGYDEHWGQSPVAGSVSSLPWLEKALNTLLNAVPSNKIIAALPLYTRDWSTSKQGVLSEELTLERQGQLIRTSKAKLVWNDLIGQYIATYTKQETKHSIWVEDSRSLSLKAQMAANKGVAGYAFWYIGSETRDIWSALRNVSKFSSY
ncbi:S-layer homology domain-containing protein [Paenibacillus sp. FA6]|uniref:S-layer homology domain-containing protein n=1 Tax=Paenibacillus sp. FA6 TaxID=3413029 RepID=UPI003F65A0D7